MIEVGLDMIHKVTVEQGRSRKWLKQNTPLGFAHEGWGSMCDVMGGGTCFFRTSRPVLHMFAAIVRYPCTSNLVGIGLRRGVHLLDFIHDIYLCKPLKCKFTTHSS